jgi:hypothetical protein
LSFASSSASRGVPLRFTFALDPLELAARCYEVEAACLRRSMAEAKRPLTAANRQTELLVIFGEGKAVTKIIQVKEIYKYILHREQRSAALPWRMFERKSGTGVPRSLYVALEGRKRASHNCLAF